MLAFVGVTESLEKSFRSKPCLPHSSRAFTCMAPTAWGCAIGKLSMRELHTPATTQKRRQPVDPSSPRCDNRWTVLSNTTSAGLPSLTCVVARWCVSLHYQLLTWRQWLSSAASRTWPVMWHQWCVCLVYCRRTRMALCCHWILLHVDGKCLCWHFHGSAVTAWMEIGIMQTSV